MVWGRDDCDNVSNLAMQLYYAGTYNGISAFDTRWLAVHSISKGMYVLFID